MAKGVKQIKVEEVKVTTTQTDPQEANAKKLRQEKQERKDPKHYISHHRGHGKASGKVVVKKGDVIEYVDRKVAKVRVETDGWVFGKKKEWKIVRGA